MAAEQPSMAAVLAADPTLVKRLLATHLADSAGRCRTCRDRDQAPMWPCRIRELADVAQDLVDARSAR